MRGLTAQAASKAQLGLGHSYSRAKVKFNVNRADNMIIQSIALLDQLDKDINTFSMRVRYGGLLLSVLSPSVCCVALVVIFANEGNTSEMSQFASLVVFSISTYLRFGKGNCIPKIIMIQISLDGLLSNNHLLIQPEVQTFSGVK